MGNLGKKSTGKLRAASVDSKTKARVSKTLQVSVIVTVILNKEGTILPGHPYSLSTLLNKIYAEYSEL